MTTTFSVPAWVTSKLVMAKCVSGSTRTTLVQRFSAEGLAVAVKVIWSEDLAAVSQVAVFASETSKGTSELTVATRVPPSAGIGSAAIVTLVLAPAYSSRISTFLADSLMQPARSRTAAERRVIYLFMMPAVYLMIQTATRLSSGDAEASRSEPTDLQTMRSAGIPASRSMAATAPARSSESRWLISGVPVAESA